MRALTFVRVLRCLAVLLLGTGCDRAAYGQQVSSGQVAYVSSSSELYGALSTSAVTTIYLTQTLQLVSTDWQQQLNVSRNVSIEAHPTFQAIRVYIAFNMGESGVGAGGGLRAARTLTPFHYPRARHGPASPGVAMVRRHVSCVISITPAVGFKTVSLFLLNGHHAIVPCKPRAPTLSFNSCPAS